MAVLDRLKLRVETDLTDAELQLMIDAEVDEIEARFGVIASITVREEGRTHFVTVHRPINTAVTPVIVEISPANTSDSANRTTLSSDDYRITNGGHTIERMLDGTNGRDLWAPLVELTYTPISDQTRRDETVIKLVNLSITYNGLNKQESVGDYSRTGKATADAYDAEREILINRLAPRGRLVMA